VKSLPSLSVSNSRARTAEGVISPWHDIPLKGSGDSYNMVVEIPKMTKAKMEDVCTEEESISILLPKKILRRASSVTTTPGPIFWNYGCLPHQTWEDRRPQRRTPGTQGIW
jgi:inorganic pyrophosphatase